MNVHRQTPTLSVTDPRGLVVREVGYCRSGVDLPAQVRVNHRAYDAVGKSVAEWDPRLFGDVSAPANLMTVYSLSGQSLSSLSVDAGLHVSLFAETGQVVQAWDGRGSERRVDYDELLRPVAVSEQASAGTARCTERYLYGDSSPTTADHNQCGQLIRHDDPAGTRKHTWFDLNGALLEQEQHFLASPDTPDWPSAITARDALLEPGAGATTVFCLGPLGDLLQQVDARGNRQIFSQAVDGRQSEVRLQLKGELGSQSLVSDLHYNAEGTIQRQTCGNGVISQWDYCVKDGRLLRLRAKRAGGPPLQDLSYAYDPVGNILSIEDKALSIRYFANQRIDPINRYAYDSLYQLIEATGYEAGSANKGPAQIPDPRAVANYRQTYRYDAGGNLLELIHEGPQSLGRVLTAARYSNRCLPEHDGRPPTEAEIAAGFDANGNLLSLERGRTLSWNLRNQLAQVQPVERESQVNDTERYVYGADGIRQRKIRSAQTNARSVVGETRYLPGLETRDFDGEILQVITVEAGRSVVQVVHWEAPPPKHLVNDQYCYQLADHLKSCALELDSNARVVSREHYHPYGSTASWGRGDSSENSFRTLGYSGKESDATGLQYFGFRYYVSWLFRWLNPDPAIGIDGLNVYRMVNNNPINFIDLLGLDGTNNQEVAEIRRLGQAHSRKIYDISKQKRTVHTGTKKKVNEKKAQELLDNPDLKYTSGAVNSLTAHAYGVMPGRSRPFIGFHNIPAPKGGPTRYRGVDSNYDGNAKSEEFYMNFGTYKIGDVNEYLSDIEQGYNSAITDPLHIGHFSVEELKANPTLTRVIANSNEMQPIVKTWINDHIQSSDGIIPILAGGPGAHAEVRALNTIVALYPNYTERMLDDVNLFTEVLASSKGPSNFIACFNCSGVIPAGVKVHTGRSSANYDDYRAARRI